MNTYTFKCACILMIVAVGRAAMAESPKVENRIPYLLSQLKDSRSSVVMVAAHRTGWHYAPENSLQGIQICIAMGVDMLELDVRKTKDGDFILMHDKTLDRTTNGTGRVADYTLAELRRFRLRDIHGQLTDEHIPSLDETMAAARGKILVYLDKTEDNIDELYGHLRGSKSLEHAVFFGHRSLPELRARYGGIADQIIYLPKIEDSTPDMHGYIHSFDQAENSPVFIIQFLTAASPVIKAIPEMKAAGKRVWASPLLADYSAGLTDVDAVKNPDPVWGWMIRHGINMFCTDSPKELLAYLRAHHLHD